MKKASAPWRRRLTASSLIFAFVLGTCWVVTPPPVQGVSANIVISQVYGGGGNSGAPFTHDFIELFNRGTAPVSLAGWSLQYASATGTGNFGANAGQITELPAVTLAPGQYFLVQEAGGTTGSPLPTPDFIDPTPIAMSATGGKVALVNTTTPLGCNGGSTPCSPATLTAVVDLVGYGNANFFEGAGATPAPSNTTSVLRGAGGCADTDNNASDFATAASGPRNTASPLNPCPVSTNPSGTGAANPASVEPGEASLLTVAVTPGASPPSTGLTVTGDLTAIGGSMTQPFFDDGTNGDVTAGDNTFSFQATVALATTPGTKNLPVTIADAQGRMGNTTITLTVATPPLAIHTIQGGGSTSPFAGQGVTTTGIVTGRRSNAFFLQTPDAEADADPNTSEGILVFTSSAPPAAAAVGNLVRVNGTVVEFIPSADPGSPPLTEIGMAPTVTLLSTGNPLPAPITLTAADTSPAGSIEQLERFEGMRVHVASLTVVGPTQGSVSEATATATSNGVFYGVITGVARPFREPGIEAPDQPPSGAIPPIPRFDANPERLRVDSDGQPGATRLEATTGATVADLTGPLDYAFRTYTLLPDPGTLTQASVVGNLSAAPVPAACAGEFTVASFNMQRFYDTVNDPGVSDTALTATAFANRLSKASLAIRNVLRLPDILGVVEVENLATLQAVADRVNGDAVAAGDPNPGYAAYLEEGNDIGGIDVGFLVKTARVNVIDVTQEGKLATYINPNNNQPETLNDRPPLVLRAAVQPPIGPAFAVTVIVNHLRSLNDIDDPVDGNRVRHKRRAQAEFLANLIQARQAADPTERIISVGDYNAFQFNDGYVDVIGAITGTPAPDDEVVLASNDLVDPDLTDLVELAAPEQRYSYVFDGNAQVLDHILVTGNLLSRVNAVHYGRSNADFPETYRNDATRPERLTDHDMPVVYVQMPLALSGASVDRPELWPPNHKMVEVAVSYTVANACGPVSCELTVASNEPVNGADDGNTAPDWEVVDAHHVRLRAERSGTGTGRVYTITITCTDGGGNVTTQAVTVRVPLNRT